MAKYSYERAALSILQWLHIVEKDLLDHELTLVGATGTVAGVCEGVRLDDAHGLKVKVADFWYPVSSIKLHGPKKCSSPTSTSASLSS